MDASILATLDSGEISGWASTIADWLGVGVSLMVVCVALGQDHIKRWIQRPKFLLEYEDSIEFCSPFEYPNGLQQGFQIRLKVSNIANWSAHEVEVHLLNVKKSGNAKKLNFVPIRLKWTHGGPVARPYLAPHTSAFVDLGCLVPQEIAQEAWLNLNTEVDTSSCYKYAGGSYEFDIAVITKDGIHKRIIFSVEFDAIYEGTQRVTGGAYFNGANFRMRKSQEVETFVTNRWFD